MPETMRALQLDAFEGASALRLVEKPIPHPKPGQVLVRVLASPVNPSDAAFCRGLYGSRRSLPVTPGFEGCGVVAAHGGGLLGWWLLGRRVACGAAEGGGLWAEYAVVPARTCLPLPARLPDELGACALVNPVTAWALFQQCRRGRHRALIQTAAAGQVGRMVLRLGARYHVPVLHVVHRPPLVELLTGLGADHVLDSSAAGFDEALREWAHRFSATLALDAVGGEMTGRVLSAMPRGTVVVYGALAGEACQVDPRDLIFAGKRVEGFWLPAWFSGRSPLTLLLALRHVVAMLDHELRTEVAVRLTLDQAARDLERHLPNASKGKILLVPGAPTV